MATGARAQPSGPSRKPPYIFFASIFSLKRDSSMAVCKALALLLKTLQEHDRGRPWPSACRRGQVKARYAAGRLIDVAMFERAWRSALASTKIHQGL